MKKYKVVDNFLEEKHFIQLKDIMEGRIGKNKLVYTQGV